MRKQKIILCVATIQHELNQAHKMIDFDALLGILRTRSVSVGDENH